MVYKIASLKKNRYMRYGARWSRDFLVVGKVRMSIVKEYGEKKIARILLRKY